jgi:hypothetical protein
MSTTVIEAPAGAEPAPETPDTKKGSRAKSPPAAGFPMVDRQQLADLLGVHPDTITDFTRKGMPVISSGGHGQRSTYDAIACSAWWRAQRGANAKEVAATRALDASARLNELKFKRETGELLPRDVVIRHGQAYTKGWVTQVMALPRRAVVTGIVTPELEPALAALCRDLCSDIHSWRSVPDMRRPGKSERNNP